MTVLQAKTHSRFRQYRSWKLQATSDRGYRFLQNRLWKVKNKRFYESSLKSADYTNGHSISSCEYWSSTSISTQDSHLKEESVSSCESYNYTVGSSSKYGVSSSENSSYLQKNEGTTLTMGYESCTHNATLQPFSKRFQYLLEERKNFLNGYSKARMLYNDLPKCDTLLYNYLNVNVQGHLEKEVLSKVMTTDEARRIILDHGSCGKGIPAKRKMASYRGRLWKHVKHSTEMFSTGKISSDEKEHCTIQFVSENGNYVNKIRSSDAKSVQCIVSTNHGWRIDKECLLENLQDELSSIFEHKMFDEIKIFVQHLEKVYLEHPEGELLRQTIFQGKSILFEDERRSKTSKEPFALPYIRCQINRLKSKGIDVIGYATHADILHIYVNEDTGYKRKEDIESELKDTFSMENCIKVIWQEQHTMKQQAGAGTILVSKQHKQKFRTEGREYGTLGVFGIDGARKNLMAFTAGHVISLGEKAYVADKESRELQFFGKCNIHLGDGNEDTADFATIDVKDGVVTSLSIPYNSNEIQNLRLCPLEEVETLEGCKVYKIGGTTGQTAGYIKHADFHYTRDDYKSNRTFVWIETGQTENTFSKPGDSGSTIFRICGRNRDTADCIAILVLGSNDTGMCLGLPISSALTEIKQKYKIVLNLANSG